MLSYRAREQNVLAQSQSNAKPLQLGNITTINLTKMSGGVQVNVVPDQYTLGFDCRAPPGGYDALKEFLAELIHRTPKANSDEVRIRYSADDGPPALTNIDEPSWWLTALTRTFTEMDCKTNWTVFPAGTDSRFLRNQGCPAIGFSPMIHTPVLLHDHNEHLPVDVFLRGITIYAQMIRNLTGERESP